MIGLAEMMNFPGVIAGDRERAREARARAEHVDGHAPGVLGRTLQAYAAAGIRSDHEAYTAEEGRERLRAGMWLLIREASAARNLAALLPLVQEFGPHRIAFCTDDREPEHIAEDGHINSMVRDAVAFGITPEDALVMASLTPAAYSTGSSTSARSRPDYQADILDPARPRVLPPRARAEGGAAVPRSRACRCRTGSADGPDRRARPGDVPDPLERRRQARVIGFIPGQIVTASLVEEPPVRAGEVLADPARDHAKIAVVERHLGTGRIGRGLVNGFGLERGALATTLSHDAHNLVVVGMSDAAMAAAARRLANIGGGIVAVDGAEVLAELPLPVAGLSATRRSRRSSSGRTPSSPRPAARLHDRGAVPADGVPRALGDPVAEAHRPRPRRRRPLRARPAGGCVIHGNCWLVTMDDAGTEYRNGWIRIEDGLVAETGSGEAPAGAEDLGGAVVTPGFVNTHHHLYQTLTRARAQQADLFTWLKTLYPRWARIDDEMEYAAARCGLAELALSGCTTVFDHHYVFPRGVSGLVEAEVRAAQELGVRLVASRGSMDLGESDGGLPPDSLVEDIDAILADTERLHSLADGALVQIAVAPCSPFSVTTRLMEESAALARRLGLQLHTHLAETVEEDAYCRELYGCTPVEYLERVGWLADDVWCAHCVHLSDADVRRSRAQAWAWRTAPRRTCGSAPVSRR